MNQQMENALGLHGSCPSESKLTAPAFCPLFFFEYHRYPHPTLEVGLIPWIRKTACKSRVLGNSKEG